MVALGIESNRRRIFRSLNSRYIYGRIVSIDPHLESDLKCCPRALVNAYNALDFTYQHVNYTKTNR